MVAAGWPKALEEPNAPVPPVLPKADPDAAGWAGVPKADVPDEEPKADGPADAPKAEVVAGRAAPKAEGWPNAEVGPAEVDEPKMLGGAADVELPKAPVPLLPKAEEDELPNAPAEGAAGAPKADGPGVGAAVVPAARACACWTTCGAVW